MKSPMIFHWFIIITTIICFNNNVSNILANKLRPPAVAPKKPPKNLAGKCDFYDGKWVVDYKYPVYNAKDCPFLLQQFDCVGNRRPDRAYLKYRWQPTKCNLARWDGKEFVRRIENKEVLFVGDSLSLNQWQSLACMLHSAFPRLNYTVTRNGPLMSTFSIPSKQVTLSYVRNALLVDIVREKSKRVLELNSVAVSSKLWTGYDILIFDTWHWWLHTGKKQPWDMIRDGKVLRKDMDRLKAYEKALVTWGKWVSNNINFNKVQVFFQGISPDHSNGTQWGKKTNTMQCKGEQKPVKRLRYLGDPDEADMLLGKVLGKTGKPIHLLKLNKMSQYRVDGHPSIYGSPRYKGMDCTHWCLPGVPDTWNQLLYANLI
ncbi:protein trichome birefringence-like 43 [Capsicum galapagoense]